MAVTIICPKCEARLKASTAPAPGQKVKCPKCAHSFSATARDIVSETRPSAPSPAASAVSASAVQPQAAKSGGRGPILGSLTFVVLLAGAAGVLGCKKGDEKGTITVQRGGGAGGGKTANGNADGN